MLSVSYDPDDSAGFNIRSKYPDTVERCVQYWDERSRGYNLTTLLALHDTEMYEHLINSLVPKGKKAKICDMGTSCGFMAIIASKMGHDVIGFDLSEKMVNYAKKNALKYHLNAEFYKADIEHLDIVPQSYDLIIAKSSIWCLSEPVASLKSWFELLKPGGHILILDGNYYLGNSEKDYAEKRHLDELRNSENNSIHGQTNMDRVNFQIIREIAEDLPASNMRRPGWDISVLLGIGFDNIYTNLSDGNPYRRMTDSGYMILPYSFVVSARRPPQGSDPLTYRDHEPKQSDIDTNNLAYEVSVFKALADVNRLTIIKYLLEERRNVKSLSALLGQSVALVSHNLKILQGANLVISTKVGKEVYYMVSDIPRMRELLYYSEM